jgi:hypothetical protein
MYRFQQRLKNFKQRLKQWNKNSFGNILQSIKEIEGRLGEIQKLFISGERTVELMKEEEQLQAHWRNEGSRRKSSGSRNPESNGSRKGKRTQNFSTEP